MYILDLTCVSFFITFGLKIILKLQNIVKSVFIPFRMFQPRQEPMDIKVGKKIQGWIEKTFTMNEYEIDNLKEQSQLTQMLFSDFPMVLMNGLIAFRVL